jgi:hypothetical protein
MLFGHFFMERFKGFLLSPWLGVGIVHRIANAGDRGELARLNRKVLALLARTGMPDKEELFRSWGQRFAASLRRWRNFEDYLRFSQALSCARSIADFLGGELTPNSDGTEKAARLAQFRSFLLDLGKGDPEPAFEQHFGHGFERLLSDWRQVVEARGLGEHEPPPPRIAEALLHRVIPLLDDPRADSWEQIRAIRDMASSGYLLGADALIRTLEDGPEEIAREAALALECISGIAAGDDVSRWWAWWQGLPLAAVPVRDTSVRAQRPTEPG